MSIEELERRLRETLGNVVVDRIKERVEEPPPPPKPKVDPYGISNTIQNWFFDDFNKKWTTINDNVKDGWIEEDDFFKNPFDSGNEGGVF